LREVLQQARDAFYQSLGQYSLADLINTNKSRLLQLLSA
jgi:DNA-binding IscR family transcriptional regulator